MDGFLWGNIPCLGDLYIYEVYLFYDEPQLFSCISKAHQFFFAMLIDSSYNSSRWLISPISKYTLDSVKGNKKTIREIYTAAETGIIWDVKYSSGRYETTVLPIEELTDEILPVEGEYLDCEFVKAASEIDDDIVQAAVSEKRDILDFSIIKDNEKSHEISCDVLTTILAELQNLFYALRYKEGGIRGAIPNQVKDEAMLCVAQSYAGSFGVRIKSNHISNFLGVTPLSECIDSFFSLISYSDDSERIMNFIGENSPRTAIKYRGFIRSLITNDVEIGMKAATPNSKHYSKRLLRREIKEIYNALEKQIEGIIKVEEIRGELTAVNSDTSSFTLVTRENERIRGYISEELRGTKFTVPGKAIITVEERIKTDPFTQEDKIEYKMLGIVECD